MRCLPARFIAFWLSSQKFSLSSKQHPLSNNGAQHDATDCAPPPLLAGAACPPTTPSAVLTVPGKAVSCTFGPGAPDGLPGGSHCRSPASWSCSRFVCRTRCFCVALETRRWEAERPLLYVPGPGPCPCSCRSVRGHPLISVAHVTAVMPYWLSGSQGGRAITLVMRVWKTQ